LEIKFFAFLEAAGEKKEKMKRRSRIGIAIVFCIALAISITGQAQSKKNQKNEASQSEQAAGVFREIMATPDKGIPQELLEKANCACRDWANASKPRLQWKARS
jgi:hypothetical protein